MHEPEHLQSRILEFCPRDTKLMKESLCNHLRSCMDSQARFNDCGHILQTLGNQGDRPRVSIQQSRTMVEAAETYRRSIEQTIAADDAINFAKQGKVIQLRELAGKITATFNLR